MVIRNVYAPITFAYEYWWEWREKIKEFPLSESDQMKWGKLSSTRPITYAFSIIDDKIIEQCIVGKYGDEKLIIFESTIQNETDVSLFLEKILPRMGFFHWEVLYGPKRRYLETRKAFRKVVNNMNDFEIPVGSHVIYTKQKTENVCSFHVCDESIIGFSAYTAYISSEKTLNYLSSIDLMEKEKKEIVQSFLTSFSIQMLKERVRLAVS